MKRTPKSHSSSSPSCTGVKRCSHAQPWRSVTHWKCQPWGRPALLGSLDTSTAWTSQSPRAVKTPPQPRWEQRLAGRRKPHSSVLGHQPNWSQTNHFSQLPSKLEFPEACGERGQQGGLQADAGFPPGSMVSRFTGSGCLGLASGAEGCSHWRWLGRVGS